jgi:hypothetical protein
MLVLVSRLLVFRKLAEVVVIGAGVLEYDVHVAIGPDVCVVAVGALQEHVHVSHRIRGRAIEQVAPDRLVCIRELASLTLLRPGFELTLYDCHQLLLQQELS